MSILHGTGGDNHRRDVELRANALFRNAVIGPDSGKSDRHAQESQGGGGVTVSMPRFDSAVALRDHRQASPSRIACRQKKEGARPASCCKTSESRRRGCPSNKNAMADHCASLLLVSANQGARTACSTISRHSLADASPCGIPPTTRDARIHTRMCTPWSLTDARLTQGRQRTDASASSGQQGINNPRLLFSPPTLRGMSQALRCSSPDERS